MKNLKNLFLLAGVIAFVGACDDNDDKMPMPIDEFINNNGAFARIISYPSGAFDINDLANAKWEITLEFDDARNGANVDSVIFEVTNVDASGAAISTPKVVKRFAKAAFVVDAKTKLPRLNAPITLTETLTALGLTTAVATNNKLFLYEWTLVTNDGRRFNYYNTDPSIIGGAFYNSPFYFYARVSNTFIPGNLFVGKYNMVQTAASTGASGANGFANSGWVFAPKASANGSVEVELTIDLANPVNGRRVWMRYLNGVLGGPTFYRVSFARTTGAVSMVAQNTGLVVCPNSTAAITIGARAGGLFTIAPAISDASFTLNANEDATAVCNPAPGPTAVAFTFTKVATP